MFYGHIDEACTAREGKHIIFKLPSFFVSLSFFNPWDCLFYRHTGRLQIWQNGGHSSYTVRSTDSLSYSRFISPI